MKEVLLAAALVLIGSAGCFAADSFQAEATATGTVVLWFQGQEATANVRADVTVSGVLILGGISTPFSVTARATGSGKGNTNTLDVDAWVALSGQGKTASGSSISVQGGISVNALDSTTTSAGGKGTGRFYLVITTDSGQWAVEGDATGSASGSFVVPDDPYSMQMTGTGAFTLVGEPHAWSSSGTAAHPDWPTLLLAELERLAAAIAADNPTK